MEDIFGLLKFQIFIWGAWNSWYFLGVNDRCWARAYLWRKNESTPSVQTYPCKMHMLAFVLVGFCPVCFCPSGLLSYTPIKYPTCVKTTPIKVNTLSFEPVEYSGSIHWAMILDFQQCGMCDQQRLRSACAYAQSGQSLC